MNRDQIVEKWMAISPRERDAWVAELFFGWARVQINESESLILPPESVNWREWAAIYDEFGIPHYLPGFTRDITAAWALLEHMHEDYYVKVESIAVECNPPGNYVCEIGGNFGWGTAPEAICLAAIIAKLTGGMSE